MLPELKTAIPGPRSRELAVELRAHESRNVTYVSPGFPVFWERANGVNVWDVDGNRFLDLTSGFGVASLGYTPEKMVAAAMDQIPRLYHAMGDVHPSAEKAALCRRLSQLTFEKWNLGPGKAILTNSGSEAVEAALKNRVARDETARRSCLHRQLSWPWLRSAHRDRAEAFSRSVHGATGRLRHLHAVPVVPALSLWRNES